MRVLLLVSEAPPVVSGISRCAQELSDGLRALGHEVDVISSNEIPRWTHGEIRISGFLAHWRRLSAQLSDYDVVNVHGPIPTMSDAFLAMVRTVPIVRRPAMVYTHHCSIDLPGLGLACAAYGSLHRRLAQVCERIVVSTASYATHMWKPWSPPIEIVPWGVDVDQYRREPRSRTPGDPLRVLFVGQMRPYKGLGVLLRAVAGEGRLVLTVAGSGHLEDRYRELARDVGAMSADFRGRVSDEELAELYRRHDVIALPSTTRAEAFGLVLLEGMAAGCAPVGSDLPGVRDLAGPTGLLVRPGSVDDLRATLLRLADNPELLDALQTASAERAAQMGWSKVAHGYDRVFRAAVRAARARRALSAMPKPWSTPQWALDDFSARFGASWASFLLFDRLDQWSVRAGWGPTLELAAPVAPRIARYVAETGSPLLLDRASALAPVRDWLIRDDVASAMSVPVRTRAGTHGVLNLSLAAGTPRRYTKGDLELLAKLV